jgi:glycine cleavage system transcriptional repressor
MRHTIVLTLTGSDRVGIVEEVTGVLLGLGGNIETSRMARLGGEFAMLVLLTLSEDKLGELDGALAHLTDRGYKVTTTPTAEAVGAALEGWLPFQVEVEGADHEGIIHDIAAGLSKAGISIESMETGTTRAAVSGITLFSMSALVLVPPSLADGEWIAALDEAGQHAGVDVEVTRQ